VKTRQRDVVVTGPRTADDRDVEALNRIFADAFTDRYRRDGLVGVRVPKLNPNIWRYALRDASDGAMLWSDGDDEIVAFNMAHHSGVEGWMGPLAVRTDMQGKGIGRAIVSAAIDWLREQRVSTIGLETMPRTVDNIGFYSRMGFLPGHLTVTAVGEDLSGDPSIPFITLSSLDAGDRDDLLAACRERLQQSAPGWDFTREHQLTHELDIGDTVVVEDGGIRGFALWHSAALVDARTAEEVRLLKLFADSPGTLDRLLSALELIARRAGLRRVAVRCQTEYRAAYTRLMERGYRVRWTDLRMTLRGFPCVQASGEGEVLLSNWEI